MGEIYIKTISVSGFEGAMMGMRAPMQSYARTDSMFIDFCNIGSNDMNLAQRLIKGGTEHSKFRRMIHVQAEVAMPRYIWSEWDTYKIATVSNSESTMHKLLNNDESITKDQFYFGNNKAEEHKLVEAITQPVIDELENLRLQYKRIKPSVYNTSELLVIAKRVLPECFIQKRVWDADYETIANMYNQRVKHPHRLKEEWVECFGKWVESLPYAKQLIIGED